VKKRTPARRSAPARGLQQYRPKVESTKGKKAYSRKRITPVKVNIRPVTGGYY